MIRNIFRFTTSATAGLCLNGATVQCARLQLYW